MTIHQPDVPNRYWVAPLYDFSPDSDNMKFLGGWQVTRTAPEVKDYLEKQFSDWFWLWPANPEFMIVLPNESIINGKPEHPGGALVTLVSAFRVLSAGRIAPGPLVLSKLENSRFRIVSFSDRSSLDDIPPGMEVGPILTPLSITAIDFHGLWQPLYQFRCSDIPKVNDLITTIHSFCKIGNLNTTLGRFNAAYCGELEDRLIDQMIAFEFLCIHDERGIKEKLSLRIAHLLGGSSPERKKQIYEDMRNIYQKRSDIVHALKKVPQEDLRGIIPVSETYLRRSLQAFLSLLSLGYSLDNIKQRLGETKTLEELSDFANLKQKNAN